LEDEGGLGIGVGKKYSAYLLQIGHGEGTGLSPDYLANRADKKLRGHLGKKLHGNREIVTEQEVGKWAPRAW